MYMRTCVWYHVWGVGWLKSDCRQMRPAKVEGVAIMAVINDVFEVVLNGDFAFDSWQNVFFYRGTVVPANRPTLANEIAEIFAVDIADPFISPVQHVGCYLRSVEVRNLYNPLEFGSYTFAPNTGGDVTGETLPKFVAWSLRSQRMPRGVHRASKRIGGLGEAALNSGIATAPMLTALQNLCTAMELPLLYDVSGVGNIWRLDMTNVQRIKYTTSSGREDYRLPENQTEGNDFLIDTWEYRGVSTQNSRK